MFKYNITRNPVIDLTDGNGEVFHKISCIGDPHLGRVFKTGVPSDRLGEREESLFADFTKLMNPTDPLIKTVVIMGDLFDRFIVSPTTLLQAFDIITNAVYSNPSVSYVLLPGNHDLSKDATKKSSYEVLSHLPNPDPERFHVILNRPHVEMIDRKFALVFDNYAPFAEERTPFSFYKHRILADTKHIIAFGHYDSLDILESGYTPDSELLASASLIVSGHEHTYREYFYPNSKTPILYTGSMQPYTHAEDPDKNIYITVDENDLHKYPEGFFKNKCLRIYCEASFVLPTPIDCLALSYLTKEPKIEELSEDDLQVLDNSYQIKLAAFLENIEDPYAKELQSLFLNKEFLDVSN